MNKIKILTTISLLVMLAACSDDEEKIKPPEPAEQLYNEAYDQLNDHQYKDAIKSFEEVERQHPSSEWATNAQIMSGFISYDTEDYPAAISDSRAFY
jgi:outer membrane protein assembly factor BamD